MGYCADPTPEMGEYSVEVRGESFMLRGEEPRTAYDASRHGIFLYPTFKGGRQGSVEILIEDIPKIRAALDQVEAVLVGGRPSHPTEM